MTEHTLCHVIHNINSYSENSSIIIAVSVNAVYSLQTFDSPLGFYNADVGRCVATELFNVTDTGEETAATPDVPSFTVQVTHPEPTPTGPTLVITHTVAIKNSIVLLSKERGTLQFCCAVLLRYLGQQSIGLMYVSLSVRLSHSWAVLTT